MANMFDEFERTYGAPSGTRVNMFDEYERRVGSKDISQERAPQDPPKGRNMFDEFEERERPLSLDPTVIGSRLATDYIEPAIKKWMEQKPEGSAMERAEVSAPAGDLRSRGERALASAGRSAMPFGFATPPPPEAPQEYWTDPRSGERYPVVEVDGRKLYEKRPGYRYSIPPEGLQEGVAAPKGEFESGSMVETATDPKEMAKGALVVGGIGIGAGLVGTALPRTAPYLMPLLKTSIPIETASNLTGGFSDVGRMVKGVGSGAVKSVMKRGALGKATETLSHLDDLKNPAKGLPDAVRPQPPKVPEKQGVLFPDNPPPQMHDPRLYETPIYKDMAEIDKLPIPKAEKEAARRAALDRYSFEERSEYYNLLHPKAPEADLTSRLMKPLKPEGMVYTPGHPDAEKVDRVLSFSRRFADKVRAKVKGPESIWTRAEELVFDRDAGLKKALRKSGKSGEEAVRAFEFRRPTSKVDLILHDADQDIFKGMSKKDIEDLNKYVTAKRAIEVTSRMPDYESIERLSTSAYRNYINAIEPSRRVYLDEKAKKIWAFFHDRLESMVDAGLLSKGDAEVIKSTGANYIPTKWVDTIDPPEKHIIKGKQITVDSSGLGRLQKGEGKYIDTDIRRLMRDYTERIENRMARNEANLALYRIAENPTADSIVRMPMPDELEPPRGWVELKAMHGGEPVSFYMKEEYASQWVTYDPIMQAALGKMIEWMSGNKILRPVATGLNPVFAATNLIKDMAYTYLRNPDAYSKFTPVAVYQMLRNFAKVAKDTAKKTGAYREWIKQGGNSTYYTAKSGLGGSAIAKLENAVSYTEDLNRMGLREQLIKNGMDPVEASRRAALNIDYSQGGVISKGLNTVVPFFNARMQVRRGLLESMLKNPRVFAYKVAQPAIAGAGLLYWYNMDHEAELANVPDRIAVDNFIFATGKKTVDENGNIQYGYIAIPKEDWFKLPFELTTAMLDLMRGKQPKWERINMAAESLVGVNITIPMFELINTYRSNYDNFREEPVWKGPRNVEPGAESYRHTEAYWKLWGKVTGLSPVRSKAALSKLIPMSNPLVGLLGTAIEGAMGTVDEKALRQFKDNPVSKIPILNRFLRFTPKRDIQAHEDSQDIEREYTTKRLRKNQEFDTHVDNLLRAKREGNEFARMEAAGKIKEMFSGMDRDTYKTYRRRYETAKKTFGIPDSGWYRDLEFSSGEERADKVQARLRRSTPEERDQILQTLRRLGLDRNKDYRRQLYRIRQQEAQEEQTDE